MTVQELVDALQNLKGHRQIVIDLHAGSLSIVTFEPMCIDGRDIQVVKKIGAETLVIVDGVASDTTGNMLDKDSLSAVAAQAEAAGMQVWMEFVSESKDGVAVMLVDGEVA
jgi:hypothetical protein